MLKLVRKNQKGQSAIEFLFTFVFSLALIFMFIGIAINYGVGYVVHYATFMASRAYMSVDPGNTEIEANITGGPGSAEDMARTVFSRYKLYKLKKEIKQNKLEFNHAGQTSIYEYVGTWYKFSSVLSPIKILTGKTEIDFKSEAFLGKEPVRAECYARTCFMMTGRDGCQDSSLDITLYDNGC